MQLLQKSICGDLEKTTIPIEKRNDLDGDRSIKNPDPSVINDYNKISLNFILKNAGTAKNANLHIIYSIAFPEEPNNLILAFTFRLTASRATPR